MTTVTQAPVESKQIVQKWFKGRKSWDIYHHRTFGRTLLDSGTS